MKLTCCKLCSGIVQFLQPSKKVFEGALSGSTRFLEQFRPLGLASGDGHSGRECQSYDLRLSPRPERRGFFISGGHIAGSSERPVRRVRAGRVAHARGH